MCVHNVIFLLATLKALKGVCAGGEGSCVQIQM